MNRDCTRRKRVFALPRVLIAAAISLQGDDEQEAEGDGRLGAELRQLESAAVEGTARRAEQLGGALSECRRVSPARIMSLARYARYIECVNARCIERYSPFSEEPVMPMIPLGLKETKDIDFRDPFKVSRDRRAVELSESSSFAIMNPYRRIVAVHSSAGTSGLSSKSCAVLSSPRATFLWPRFAAAVILRRSRISEGGPISRRARREVTGGRIVMTFDSRSLGSFFLDGSSFLAIITVHGVKRAMLITRLPVLVFRWTLLLSTDTSQGKVSCRIFPFTVTRT